MTRHKHRNDGPLTHRPFEQPLLRMARGMLIGHESTAKDPETRRTLEAIVRKASWRRA